MNDDDETELRNPFPSPPSHYTNYTSHNLRLLALLRERAAAPPATNDVDPFAPADDVPAPGGGPLAVDAAQQRALLADQTDVPEWPLAQLEKPRVDWILEDGQYSVFGDTWFVKETIPSLAELGGHQLYPEDPSVDRRPALLSIMRSMLVSYSALMKSLLAPPPPPASTEPPEWQRHVEWITVLSQNLMAAANDLRPVQARVNLEAMMQRQLALRKEETQALHLKCDALETRLAELRGAASQSSLPAKANSPSSSSQLKTSTADGPPIQHARLMSVAGDAAVHGVTTNDVFRWAEEAG